MGRSPTYLLQASDMMLASLTRTFQELLFHNPPRKRRPRTTCDVPENLEPRQVLSATGFADLAEVGDLTPRKQPSQTEILKGTWEFVDYHGTIHEFNLSFSISVKGKKVSAVFDIPEFEEFEKYTGKGNEFPNTGFLLKSGTDKLFFDKPVIDPVTGDITMTGSFTDSLGNTDSFTAKKQVGASSAIPRGGFSDDLSGSYTYSGSLGNRQVTITDNGRKISIKSLPGQPGDEIDIPLKRARDGSLSGKFNLIFMGPGGKSTTKGNITSISVNGNTISGSVLLKPHNGEPFTENFTLTKNL